MRVLIADDSIVFRSALRGAIDGAEGVVEVVSVSNGEAAVEALSKSEFDTVILDIEMPKLDGIEAVKKIREFDSSVHIIMFSSPTMNQAKRTMTAFQNGANDFVLKSEALDGVGDNIKNARDNILPRLKTRKAKKGASSEAVKEGHMPGQKSSQLVDDFKSGLRKPKALFFGSSTGGPDLWRKIFADLGDLRPRAPMFLVQHMPPVFTKQFADMLDKVVSFPVKEAKHGEIVEDGHMYIAPGDYHMRLKKDKGKVVICLDQEEKVCYVRPAVDCLFDTAIEAYGSSILAFIFTGMGNDGADSCKKLKDQGATIFIQDRESCAVYGMPGAVEKVNGMDAIIKGQEIPNIIKGANS